MSQEILTVKPTFLLKFILPLSIGVTFIIGMFQGDLVADNLGSVLAVYGVFFVIAFLHFFRMNSYYATLFTDKLVVKNFWGRKEFPFQGLTGMSNVEITSVSGGNPIWIRSFEMHYGNDTKKVRIAGLGYNPGKQLLDTMQGYFQQLAAAGSN